MCLPSNMSHKADCVNLDSFPILYCLVCLSAFTVEYSSCNFSSVRGFYDLIPEELRELFVIVEYRVNQVKE